MGLGFGHVFLLLFLFQELTERASAPCERLSPTEEPLDRSASTGEGKKRAPLTVATQCAGERERKKGLEFFGRFKLGRGCEEEEKMCCIVVVLIF